MKEVIISDELFGVVIEQYCFTEVSDVIIDTRENIVKYIEDNNPKEISTYSLEFYLKRWLSSKVFTYKINMYGTYHSIIIDYSNGFHPIKMAEERTELEALISTCEKMIKKVCKKCKHYDLVKGKCNLHYDSVSEYDIHNCFENKGKI